ncbi:thimanine synthesis protein ThiJ [Virgisporangium aliadipatigenens]|uniref:Thimanine synthesis protein ThiJ n=1 Tax=Virgisporangium aliadipatigenens TaxID=741659 RepID=A0A8J3YWC8_9ACTN|nr:DJ-1/PfpI family protein [Virgisporangium aliadipatigenens]GIJ51768.1 thimanine synthesis protein ThiJ [Virgisporangium aliadipatigenens]
MERRTLLGAAAAAPLTGPAVAAASNRSAGRPLRVQVVMFDGAEEQDYTAPYEVFSLAGRLSGGAARVSYVTATGPRVVTASWGTRVEVANGWAPREADLLVVPGGGFGRPNEPGIWAEINEGTLPRLLAAAAPRRGLTVSSLCTGAIVLAAAGLTSGRPCTTHTGAKAELARRGGVVKDARVVDDRDLVTAAGVTSGLELALHLVRRELGADVAIACENVLEYESRGIVWTS